jgi:RNA polymerase sigma factor (sigma-70 family)
MIANDEQEELGKLLRSFWSDQGSPEARRRDQNELCNRLKTVLNRHAMRVVNNNEELARVALQEAWLKIFRSARSYDPARASVRTWAKLITTQCAINELRAHYRRLPADPGATEPDTLACPLPNPEQALDAAQFQRAVADCVAALPSAGGPNYRLALQLALDQEVSRTEMVEILAAQRAEHHGVNLEQVQMWIRRARAKLVQCLQGKQQSTGDAHA